MKADAGYVLVSGGKKCLEAETKDYTQWQAIPDPDFDPAKDAEQEAEKNRKAAVTLSTIFKTAHDLNKLSDDDERMEAVDKKLREQFPDCDMETNVPPIEAVLAVLREEGLGEFADAFDKAWADEDFMPIIDAMPEIPADDVTDEGEGEGEGEDEKPADETAAPAEGEGKKPADESAAPAEGEGEKPADEQPAEEKPKTKKSKAAKAE